MLVVARSLGPGSMLAVAAEWCLVVNAGLTLLGSGTGGLMTGGGTAERVELALLAAFVGFLSYSALTYLGGMAVFAVADKMLG
jgi:hypothetical protein